MLHPFYQQNNLVAEAEYVSNLNSYYGDMGTSSSGMVTNDFFQDVYILEDKKTVEVLHPCLPAADSSLLL